MLHDQRDGIVAFGERGESLRAQSPEDISLSKSDAGFDLHLVPRLARTCREVSNRIMRRHSAIGSVDFGVVERILVDALFRLSGARSLGTPPAHMSVGPIRQLWVEVASA